MEQAFKTNFVVLGMHRSGTSALTRVLNLLGAQLPENILKPDRYNETGYWEPQNVITMNDKVLSDFQRHWADPKPFSPPWLSPREMASLQDDAARLLMTEYEQSGPIVLKDPRLSRTLPVWKNALLKRGTEQVYLIACRNPMEVARSLAFRDGLSLRHGLYLWASYMLEAERNTRGRNRLVIRYEGVLSDWRQELRKVGACFGLSEFSEPSNDVQDRIDDYLNPAGRHHVARKSDLDLDSEVPELVKCLYDLFLRFPEKPTEKEFDRINAEWQAFWRAHSPGTKRSDYVERIPQVQFEKGRTLAEQGHVKEALELVEAAATALPRQVMYQFKLGELFEQLGALAKAEDAFRRATEINANMIGVHLALARVQRVQGKKQAARSTLKAVQSSHPDNGHLHVQLGILEEQSGALSSAERCYGRAAELNAELFGAYLGLARVQRVQGKLELARSSLDAAGARQPDNAAVYFQRGLLEEQYSALSDAEQCFRRAIELNADLIGAYLGLARVRRAQGKKQSARAALQEARSRQPDNAPVCLHLGILEEQSGALSAAEQCFRRATEVNADMIGAHLGLARVCRKFGRLDDAKSTIESALKTHPLNAELHYELGNLLELRDNMAAAIEAHSIAARLDETALLEATNADGLAEGNTALDVGFTPPQKRALIRVLAWQASEVFAREAVEQVSQGNAATVAGQLWPLGAEFPLDAGNQKVDKSRSGNGPVLSVVIPAYEVKSEHWLTQAIESVLLQDKGGGWAEILVVDDGSSNDTAKLVAQKYAPRVKYFRNPETLGLSENFNRCIALANGKFIHILHQDDFIRPGFYEALLPALQADEALVAAFSKSVDVNDAGQDIMIAPSYRETAGFLRDWSETIMTRKVLDTVRFPSVIMRRRVLEEIGGFSTTLSFVVDWDMFIRLAASGPLWYDPQPLACFRIHDTSETMRQRAIDRTIDSMRGALLNLNLLPENKRLNIARTAFFHDLKIAGDALVTGNRDKLPQCVYQDTLHLLLRGQNKATLISCASKL